MRVLDFAVKILVIIIYIPILLVVLPWWVVGVIIQTVLKITTSYQIKYVTPHSLIEAVLEELFW